MHLLAGRPGRARKNFHVSRGSNWAFFNILSYYQHVLPGPSICNCRFDYLLKELTCCKGEDDAKLFSPTLISCRSATRSTRGCVRGAKSLPGRAPIFKMWYICRPLVPCYWPCSKKRRWDTCLNSFHVHFWHCCCWAERRFAHPLTFVADRSLEWNAKVTFHLILPSMRLHFCCLTCCVTL